MTPNPGLPVSTVRPEPYFDDGQVTVYLGDCRHILPALGRVDAIVTDPPYGDTALEWDRAPGWQWVAAASELTDQAWCFGSMRFWLTEGHHFPVHGWTLGQDIVWEKHNGSGFQADRFRRVHEHAVHWYRGPWGDLHREVQVTHDAVGVRGMRWAGPSHAGSIGSAMVVREDGGPRLQRSVIHARSEQKRAVHPTQKPLGILRPLIGYSVPPGGVVLDPFAGSGSTLIAARDLGRRAIGIEVREEYAAATVKRLAQATLDMGATA